MANLLLNNAPQSIPDSKQGCVFNGTNSFYYGYSNTESTDWLFGNVNTEMHYDGKNGLLWAKVVSSSDTTELIYFVDVTEPLQVPGAVIQEVPGTPASFGGLYWWLPLYSFYYILGIIPLSLTIGLLILLSIAFPIACQLGKITTFTYNSRFINLSQGWENQEVYNGLFHSIEL